MIKNFDPLNSSLHLIHETEFEDSDDDYDDSESLKSKYSDSEESDYTSIDTLYIYIYIYIIRTIKFIKKANKDKKGYINKKYNRNDFAFR